MVETENQYMETDLGNISINPRGEYTNDANYEYLDTVSYNGGSYMCIIENGLKVSGVPPTENKNTDTWQMISLPGGLTPEYIAAHDDVINNSKTVSKSKDVVEEIERNVKNIFNNITTLKTEVDNSKQTIETCKDEVAVYSQNAEESKNASEQAELAIRELVSGFDSHVAQQTTEASNTIIEERQTAIQSIKSQEQLSTDSIEKHASSFVSQKETEAETAISEYTNTEIEKAKTSLTDIKNNIDSSVEIAEEKNNALTKAIQDAEVLDSDIGITVTNAKAATTAATEAASNADDAATRAKAQSEKTKEVTDILIAQVNHISFQIDPDDGGLNIVYTE